MKEFLKIVVIPFIIGYGISQMIVHAHGAEDKTPKFVCGPNAEMEKVITEKGYHHLLDMTAENGVVENIWSGGQQIVVTAQKDEKTICFLSTFDKVTFNPKTIEKIYNVYKSTQKDL